MPRLRLTFKEIIDILKENGFELKRQKGSHITYEGYVKGRRQCVQVAPHGMKSVCSPKTLKSIIEQSGLGKKAFQKE